MNHLPAAPLAGETKAAYNLRLAKQIAALKDPIYITSKDGSYRYHSHPFVFGELELQGLKIFLGILLLRALSMRMRGTAFHATKLRISLTSSSITPG